ncbi:xylulose kinase-like [Lingula anatina]|uniref:Xylulose kinase n=1 Tax=Lingula anatina TaxID=7574 RepID=A0A1S3J5G9_LINAN|nr:xylulose kinase-like [Lingula anatina]|eukprot:XP_013405667.1 xylulose kinase-like [Lingula anatina]
MSSPKTKRTFLGFDFSTQQVKAMVIDDTLKVINETHIKFDTDLPEFRTRGGVHVAEDNVTITAPTIMWVKTLDLLLEKMKKGGVDFSTVAALSGSGQQHGSVYWKMGARQVLSTLQPNQTLAEQLKDCFSIPDSPVWMDSSTTEQCRQLEKALGGPQALADLTGAKAFERYTGNQIAKIYQTNREGYDNTERISLVSSFGACLFLGDYAPIDSSDGSGMNLMNIRKRVWDPDCLKICGGETLEKKLGQIVPSHTNVGPISSYFVDRYGFSPDCRVIVFTGDNPASLAGMTLNQGAVGVTLGTSDCVFLWLVEPKPNTQGVIFSNPVQTSNYMALLCFKNGSLTREGIRDKCADGSWEKFDQLLELTPKGNNGNIGMYFDVQEITPSISGVHRFTADNQKVSSFSDAVEVRAVLEGQFLSRRTHAENLGFALGPSTKILATGGASVNKPFLQVIADVFASPVYTLDVANSTCLGAAYMAKHGWLGGDKVVSFDEVVKGALDYVLAAEPDTSVTEMYNTMADRYRRLEQQIAKEQGADY